MLKPLGDRVLIKPDARPDQTDSGLHLVQDWNPETTGEVVAVGDHVDLHCPECLAHVRHGLQVAVGDTVVFSWQSGQEIREDGERYLLMREADILAVLESV